MYTFSDFIYQILYVASLHYKSSIKDRSKTLNYYSRWPFACLINAFYMYESITFSTLLLFSCMFF